MARSDAVTKTFLNTVGSFLERTSINVNADVVLPNLGFGMEEGRLIAWLKAPGDPIRKGEAIAEVEGDKAAVELEAVVDGVLVDILVQADATVPVGTVLAHIRTGAAEAAPTAPTPAPAPSPVPVPAPPADADTPRVSPVAQRLAQENNIDLSRVSGTGPGGRIVREDVQAMIDRGPTPANRNGSKVLAAPAVRKLARDRGIDLATVGGTGFDGHITRADVEALLSAPAAQSAPAPAASPTPAPIPQPVAPAPAPVAAATAPAPFSGERQEIPMSRMRQTIARQLVRSAQEAPHVYVQAQLDLTDALRALPKGVGVNALLLYLTVQTLKDIPDLNATYEDGHLYHYPHINLAVAVALPDGLITPTLQRADDFSLTGLAERTKDMVSRARNSRLRPEEMSGGTFTVSNLGIVEQIERFTAILNPPQVGILAVGAAKERPLVINGGIHVRTTAYFSLSVDHRIIDGLGAARFLEAYDRNMQAFKG